MVLKQGKTVSSRSQASCSDGQSTRGWSCDVGEVETHVGMQKMWAMLSEVHQEQENQKNGRNWGRNKRNSELIVKDDVETEREERENDDEV